MILLVHMLLGAVMGQKVLNPFIAIVLAFLSHYFLDLFPHVEYNIENLNKKQWQKSIPDVLKVFLDFCFGVLFISIFSNQTVIVYICAFFAILPDGFSVLNMLITNKISQQHSELHQSKIHFLSHKKIPIFWRLFSQTIAIIVSTLLLKF